MSKPKNSEETWEFVHRMDTLAIQKQKDEIERLCAWGRGLESDLSHARVEISFLKAEVERLRKAGDAMAEALNLNDDVFDNLEKKEAQANWNAAKEGKPSA